MTTGSGDEKAMGTTGHGHLRASHADRDHVIDALKAAFVDGRLTKDEFDVRVGQTFASQTCAELAALTTDLPAGPGRSPAASEARPGSGQTAGEQEGRQVEPWRVCPHSASHARDCGPHR
jgi:hypothetical protein